jgi:3D (Asp-Asp-Asp) domain-containing protein
MRQCTPPIPKSIHEVCYLLVSRLEVICHKCPHAVKERLHYGEDDWGDVAGDAKVMPLGMQIDAFNLLEEELTAYFRYPMFMPNAQDVVSRTIDIFFAASGDSFSVGTRTVDSRSV